MIKDNESEKIVKMQKIFDGDIDVDLKDFTFIENLSINDINVDNTSNIYFLVTYGNEFREKDLYQAIDHKHPIIKEEISIAASDALKSL